MFNTERLPLKHVGKRVIASLPRTVQAKIPSAALPVQYQEAVKALAACTAIDEAKTWSDKAEALAAWAKVYRDDKVAVEARRLKLHAYRRMGQLADQVTADRRAFETGPRAALVNHGLSREHARNALRIGRAPKERFEAAVEAGRGVSVFAHEIRRFANPSELHCSEAWDWLCKVAKGYMFHSSIRKQSARELAAGIAKGEVESARKLAIELIEWLDEFEQALPKK